MSFNKEEEEEEKGMKPLFQFPNAVTSPFKLRSRHRLWSRVQRVELYISVGSISPVRLSLRNSLDLSCCAYGYGKEHLNLSQF
ncbi:uncharacterized protein DS421_20g688800 [Arachis hypogaea]|nr:uncharacterized protein DS421_20g688800 [Arachis hypogaea]